MNFKENNVLHMFSMNLEINNTRIAKNMYIQKFKKKQITIKINTSLLQAKLIKNNCKAQCNYES